MADRHVKSDLPAYLSGALSEPSRREVESHLASCESCRQAAERIKARQERLKRQTQRGAENRVPNLLLARLGRQAGVDERPSRAPWVWAVVLLAGVLAAIVMLRRDYRAGPTPSGTTGLASTDTVSTSTAPEQAAAGFEVAGSSPALEESQTPKGQQLAAEGFVPREWSGADSGIREPREAVVRNRAAWRELWAEMQQVGPAPRLDFDKVIVAAYFAGPRPGPGYQVVLSRPVERAEDVAVPVQVTGPGPGARESAGPTHPYAIATLPRTPKRVRFIRQPEAR